MEYNLTLVRNNTGQDTFLFYEEVDGGKNFITESVVYINESIVVYKEDIGDTFYITTPTNNDDFDFTSGSL